MMRYIAEQYEKNKRPAHRFYGDGYTDYANTLVQYRDYLCMCEGLEYDLKNSFVLFPRDLKDAHDKVASLSDPEKAAIYERQIQQAYPLLEKLYRFERDGWTIMAPKTSKEITEEGHRLHHCVGGYVKRVAMKECIILFSAPHAEIGQASRDNRGESTMRLCRHEDTITGTFRQMQKSS